jgi:ABC-type antimicrobial peptide transport system permease subunit
VYLPFDETFFSSGRETAPFVVVRPSYRAAGLADALRKAAQEAGGPVAVERIRSGRDWLGDYVSEHRRRTVLIGLLSALGLALSLIGIFGVTAYSVARRTQEIGVRMAFGARPRQVVGRIVGDVAWPMVLGIVIGLTGAYFATRVLESFLYETTTSDPATFLSMTALMAATALIAAWIPARRAARVDPVQALRAE